MFELMKVCDAFEALSAVERRFLLTKKSVVILSRLHSLSIPGVKPIDILAGYIVGSAVADGGINEMEYLLIYPALVRTFGDDFDFASIKESFRRDRSGTQKIADYLNKMADIFGVLDEALKWDVIMLCLGVMSENGRVTPKEKRYIRRLCET